MVVDTGLAQDVLYMYDLATKRSYKMNDYVHIHARCQDGPCCAMAHPNGQIFSWSFDHVDASTFPRDVAERLIEEYPHGAFFHLHLREIPS
jgi:hypothetical protein